MHSDAGFIIAAVGLIAAVQAIFGREPGGRNEQRRRERAGAAGERKVSRILDTAGIPHVDDVTIEYRGRTVQIDHILDLGDRLLAIETKHLSGSVEPARSGPWVHRPRRGEQRRFQSPVEQNNWHRRAIGERFGVFCDGLVVFSGSAAMAGPWPGGVVSLQTLPAILRNLRRPSRQRIGRAMDTIRRIKASPRQPTVAKRHVADLRRRYGSGPGRIHAVVLGILMIWGGLSIAF